MPDRVSPATLRRLFRLWPPFIGAGIRVTEIAADWHCARVRRKIHVRLKKERRPAADAAAPVA